MSGCVHHNGCSDQHEPMHVKGIHGVRRVACGGQHNLAVNSAGRLLTWGAAQNGSLGLVRRWAWPAGCDDATSVTGSFQHDLIRSAAAALGAWAHAGAERQRLQGAHGHRRGDGCSAGGVWVEAQRSRHHEWQAADLGMGRVHGHTDVRRTVFCSYSFVRRASSTGCCTGV